MSIIRIEKKERPFVQVDKECINHPYLTLKAKGLHTYMMSKPDDWVFYTDKMAEDHLDGIKAIRSALNELESEGYLRRTQAKDDKGKFGNAIMVLHEVSTFTGVSPVGLKPARPISARPNRHASNNDITNKDLSNNDYISSDELEGYCNEYAKSIGWLRFMLQKFTLPKPASKKPLLWSKKTVAAAIDAGFEKWKANAKMTNAQKVGFIGALEQELDEDGVIA